MTGYDALSRVISDTQTVNATPYTVNYSYEDNGNRARIVYPSAKTLDYVYDDNNRLDVIKQGGVNFVDYNYDSLDRPIQKSYLSTMLLLTTYTYDIANQLAQVNNSVNGGGLVSRYEYPLLRMC